MAINRNRVIYSAAALYVGPTPSTGQHFSSGNSGFNLIQQIPRAQDVSVNFSIPRTDVNQLGQLAAIDRIIVSPPTVGLNLSWLLVDGKAESVLGFAASGQSSFISGLLDGSQGDKNYFVLLASEGVDAIGNTSTGTQTIMSVGNGFVSNYGLNLAVGQLPKASLSIEGLNFKSDSDNTGNFVPAINPLDGTKITNWNFTLPTAVAYTGSNIPNALRPGDLRLSLPANASVGNILSGVGMVNIQSMDFSLPLSRETLSRLGNPFAYSRQLSVPIRSTLTISALQADHQDSNLADVFCNDQFYNFGVTCQVPDCAGTGRSAVKLDFKNAKLESQDQSISIGGAATTSMTFQCQLAGIGDYSNGFFMSGSYS